MNAPLQSVDRALVVLLSYDEDRTDWGVTELAEEFGWDKSVAQRLLATLAHRGFLISQPGSRRYRLGPAMWHLGFLWERKGGLAALARPVLDRVARRTAYTTTLAVPDGVHTRCVAAVAGDNGPARQYPLVGELYAAQSSATSRAYFAMLPEQARATLFDDVADGSFAETRNAGYAYSETGHTAALAVPVVVRDNAVAALTLLGRDIIPADHHPDLADELHTAALEIAHLLTPRPERKA